MEYQVLNFVEAAGPAPAPANDAGDKKKKEAKKAEIKKEDTVDPSGMLSFSYIIQKLKWESQ